MQVSVEVAQQHMAWNLESVERCVTLSSEASCPSHVRQLFHPTPTQHSPHSCLLPQLSRLMVGGLSSAVEACMRASDAPYGLASAGSATRAAIAKAADTVSCYQMLCLPVMCMTDIFDVSNSVMAPTLVG